MDWGRFESISLLPLYITDVDPIERLWLIMKAEWFTGYYTKTKDELIPRKDEKVRTCPLTEI